MRISVGSRSFSPADDARSGIGSGGGGRAATICQYDALVAGRVRILTFLFIPPVQNPLRSH
jgi:hypothetical protein